MLFAMSCSQGNDLATQHGEQPTTSGEELEKSGLWLLPSDIDLGKDREGQQRYLTGSPRSIVNPDDSLDILWAANGDVGVTHISAVNLSQERTLLFEPEGNPQVTDFQLYKALGVQVAMWAVEDWNSLKTSFYLAVNRGSGWQRPTAPTYAAPIGSYVSLRLVQNSNQAPEVVWVEHDHANPSKLVTFKRALITIDSNGASFTSIAELEYPVPLNASELVNAVNAFRQGEQLGFIVATGNRVLAGYYDTNRHRIAGRLIATYNPNERAPFHGPSGHPSIFVDEGTQEWVVGWNLRGAQGQDQTYTLVASSIPVAAVSRGSDLTQLTAVAEYSWAASQQTSSTQVVSNYLDNDRTALVVWSRHNFTVISSVHYDSAQNNFVQGSGTLNPQEANLAWFGKLLGGMDSYELEYRDYAWVLQRNALTNQLEFAKTPPLGSGKHVLDDPMVHNTGLTSGWLLWSWAKDPDVDGSKTLRVMRRSPVTLTETDYLPMVSSD